MTSLPSARVEEVWKRHFVVYEDMLASFYALQDSTQLTLEQSYSIGNRLTRLEELRKTLLEALGELRASADDGRVAEIERKQAAIQLDGLSFDVEDLVASRTAGPDTLLELSFRVDPLSIPRFVKLTSPIRIKFPFGESTYVAAFRLVRFRMVRDQFVFRFATVDPI